MNEPAEILRAAEKYGVPAAALAALRVAENGGPGREFGVLSVPAPTYRQQAEVAANSLRNAEARFEAAYLQSSEGRGRARDFAGRYTDAFLRFFSGRWAPAGAENDPRGLNAHHAQNLIDAYRAFLG